MCDCIPLIAVPPGGKWLAIAWGKNIHIFQTGSSNSEPLKLSSTEDVRVLCVSSDQLRLLSSGDDKAVNIWSTETWELLHHSSAAKKVASGCFTPDSQHAIIGDKFGDVSVMPAQRSHTELMPLLGHYCATITALAVDASGRALASGDRDGKLRVSILPEDPLAGSWEIMSYCLLHTAAITCATFCGTGTGQEAVLVSGALDGQIIAWDHTTGADLSVMLPSTCAKCEESDNATVGVVALVAQGQMIAAALERQAAVVIVRCCRGGGGAVELREVARVAVHGISLPCRMHWSSAGKVWVVGCASVDGTAAVAAGYIHQSGSGNWESGQDVEMSGAVANHVDKAEGRIVAQYPSLLLKRDYPLEEREERKGRGKKRSQPGGDAHVVEGSQS